MITVSIRGDAGDKQRDEAEGNLQAGAASPEIRGLFFLGRDRAMMEWTNSDQTAEKL